MRDSQRGFFRLSRALRSTLNKNFSEVVYQNAGTETGKNEKKRHRPLPDLWHYTSTTCRVVAGGVLLHHLHPRGDGVGRGSETVVSSAIDGSLEVVRLLLLI